MNNDNEGSMEFEECNESEALGEYEKIVNDLEAEIENVYMELNESTELIEEQTHVILELRKEIVKREKMLIEKDKKIRDLLDSLKIAEDIAGIGKGKNND